MLQSIDFDRFMTSEGTYHREDIFKHFIDVTSKVGDHVKFDEASPFFLVNLCQHQNKKNVMSTIMKTMIFSSFLCIFAIY